jgi:transposase
MAMGRRNKRIRQEELWIPAAELPVSVSHPFYDRLNRLLDEQNFDGFVENLCTSFYAEKRGRPGLAPGIYFRLLMVGYFEGTDSERGIAWRASDSLAIRSFVRIALDEAVPDHSTRSRTRRLIDVETHQAVFQWVLPVLLAEHKLLKGTTVGVDATTLEANAALRSIVRRDTDEAYNDFLVRLAKESGIDTPTREQLAKLDRKRPRKGSNDEWRHPHDPDARITKMKDGRTHLAHKAEHAVDMETGALIAVTIQSADQGDTTTIVETVAEAGKRIAEAAEAHRKEDGARVNPEGPSEVVTDKGYHSRKAVSDLTDAGVRTYCAEPQRGHQRWQGQKRQQQAVYSNRRRIRGRRGKQLLRQRGEKLERWNQHLYDRGGMRRVHLRGHQNILKRLVIHAAAGNLGLLMQKMFGMGTPKRLQGHSAAALGTMPEFKALIASLWPSVIARSAIHTGQSLISASNSPLTAAA